MSAVHIRIGHDNDLVIAKLADIEIISVALGKAATEGVDHGFDLCVGQNLVNACLFHVQNLTTDGKNSLEITVSCCLGAASCRVSLYDKDLA